MINSFTTRVNLRKEAEVKDPGVFVDLLVDGNFKLIFSNPANKDILISLLNEFIPSKISDLKLVMQEKRGRQAHLKNSIFDLDCEFDDGRTAVVEVQFNSRKIIPLKRCISYLFVTLPWCTTKVGTRIRWYRHIRCARTATGR